MTMIAPTNPPERDEYPPVRPIDRRMRRLIASFRVAFVGIWYLFRTQRNAQIHLLIGGCALALGLFLPLERWEWLGLVLICGIVLAAEGMNTALEAVVDLAAPGYHPLAKVAKDVGAGAVLMCAITAVVVGCIIFVPHLLDIVWWLLGSTR